MTIDIFTPRLVLRTPSTDDLAGYLAYRNEEKTLASQMMAPIDEASAATFLQAQSVLPDDASGWRMMSIERRDLPGIIGEAGFFTSPENLREGDMGWWLHSNHRGKGYALEAVRALMGWCFFQSRTASRHRPLPCREHLIPKVDGASWHASGKPEHRKSLVGWTLA
jgi:aminoglycoside 6'-N-acetyltransferase